MAQLEALFSGAFPKLEFLKRDRIGRFCFAKLFSGTLQNCCITEETGQTQTSTHIHTHTQRFSAALSYTHTHTHTHIHTHTHKCWSPVDTVILLTFGKIVELGPKPTITEITLYDIFSGRGKKSGEEHWKDCLTLHPCLINAHRERVWVEIDHIPHTPPLNLPFLFKKMTLVWDTWMIHLVFKGNFAFVLEENERVHF